MPSNATPRRRRPRVALVAMPWLSATFGSAALAILKSALRSKDVAADAHYLNLRLARRVGLPAYQFIGGDVGDNLTGLTLGEWMFSRHLFGALGTREVDNDLPSMRGVPGFTSARRRLRLRAGLSEAGLRRLMDDEIAAFLSECLGAVDWGRYDLIGFSSVFWSQLSSLALAKRLKERFPSIPIVFGGANVSAEMGHETLRAFPWIDYVVDGEGEEALAALALSLAGGAAGDPDSPIERRPGGAPPRQAGEGVAGVSRRAGAAISLADRPSGRADLARLPPPDYDEYLGGLEEAGLTGQLEPLLFFEGSRGCWFGEKSHCTFCGFNWKTMEFRAKPAARLVREILWLNRRYRAHHLYCTDNILDMEYFRTFLPRMRRELRRRRLDLRLFYEVKSNLTAGQIRQLAEGGVREVQAGIESLSTEVLRLMRKGVTGIQNVQTLKFCREHGVQIFWNILYAIPGERPSEYRAMLEALPSLTHLRPPYSLTRLYLERFSPYQADPARFGLSRLKPKAMYSRLYPPGVDLDKVAYFFDYDPPPGQPDPEPYIAPIRRLVERWRRFVGRTFCFRVRSLRGLEIHDYRLRDPAAEEPAYRRVDLDAHRAAIYEFCESHRALEAVCAFAAGPEGGRLAPAQTRALLDDWVARRLMYREGERYLSLALSVGCQHEDALDRALALEALHALSAGGAKEAPAGPAIA